MKPVFEAAPRPSRRTVHQWAALYVACLALATPPPGAQVLITYTNSGNANWGNGITAHNMPTLEAAQAQIVYDLRNVEPPAAAQGGIPSSRFYTYEGCSRDSSNNTIYSYTTNVFDYRFWNDTHWNCWTSWSGPNLGPESLPVIPGYIKNTENSLGSGCVIFTDVHYTSDLYADSVILKGYGYRANLFIQRADGRTYSDQVRGRKMRADIAAPDDPKKLGCQSPSQ